MSNFWIIVRDRWGSLLTGLVVELRGATYNYTLAPNPLVDGMYSSEIEDDTYDLYINDVIDADRSPIIVNKV